MLLLISFSSIGGGNSIADPLEIDGSNKDRLDQFVLQIRASHYGESKQLRKIVAGIHAQFLKTYKPYSDLSEAFKSGTYDCLTATTLMSKVLDEFGYHYSIIETNYHIFLMVQTSSGKVLIETTDRIGGYITRKGAIDSRISEYKKNQPQVEVVSGNIHRFPFSLFQEISEENLGGLLLFNQAVKAYNSSEYVLATNWLIRSEAMYSSPRCASLCELLIQTIKQSNLNEKEKADCLVRLRNLPVKQNTLMALN